MGDGGDDVAMLSPRRESPGAILVGGHRYYVLALLFLIFVLATIDRMVVGLLQEPIKAEFGLSDGQLGLMTGFAFALFYTTLSLPAARLIDCGMKRTNLLASALTLWSVMTAACGLAQNYVQLLLARLAVGLGEAGASPPSLTLISDYFRRDERGRAMALYSLGIPIGSMIGLAAGGWAADRFGWRGGLLIVGLPGVVVAILFRLTVREPARGMADGGAPLPARPVPLRHVYATLFGKSTYRHLAAAASLASFCAVGMVIWFPAFFMRRFALSLSEVGLYWGLLAGVAGVTGSWLGGWLCDRVGRSRPALIMRGPGIALLLSIVPSIFALNAQTWQVAMALLAVPMVCGSIWIAPTMALTQGLAPLAMRGLSGASIAFCTNMIGPGLAPLILGGASDAMAGVTGNDSDGLRWALLLSTGVLAWSALHFFIAARTVERDLGE